MKTDFVDFGMKTNAKKNKYVYSGNNANLGEFFTSNNFISLKGEFLIVLSESPAFTYNLKGVRSNSLNKTIVIIPIEKI